MRRILEHRNDSPLYLVGCTYLFFDAFLRSRKSSHPSNHQAAWLLYRQHSFLYREELPGRCEHRRHRPVYRAQSSYFGKGLQRGHGRVAAAVPHRIPHGKGVQLLKLSSLSIRVRRSVGYRTSCTSRGRSATPCTSPHLAPSFTPFAKVGIPSVPAMISQIWQNPLCPDFTMAGREKTARPAACYLLALVPGKPPGRKLECLELRLFAGYEVLYRALGHPRWSCSHH